MGKNKKILKLQAKIDTLRNSLSVAYKDISELISAHPDNDNCFDARFRHSSRDMFDKFLLAGRKNNNDLGISNSIEKEFILANHKYIITYADTKDLPKTMKDVQDYINIMETIFKMPGCNLSEKGSGFVVMPEHNLEQTLEIELLKKEIEKLRKDNEEYRLNAKKSIDLSFKQLKDHIAEKDELKAQLRKVDDGCQIIQVPIGSFIVPPTDNEIIKNHLDVIQKELHKETKDSITLKDVNVWGHNVGDINFEKSELLDGDKTQERLHKAGKVITLQKIGNIPNGTILYLDRGYYVNIEIDNDIAIPPCEMLDYWKENKVRLLSPLEMCENQECAQ